MAQADLKATHYTQQLQNCLTRGLWADPAPGKAAKGPPMSWQELVRKFKKHSSTRHITAELALHTQSLSILLLPPRTDMKNVTAEDLDGDSDEPHRSLALGKECELDQSRVEDARLGFAALELLNDTPNERDSALFTRAYFAYALKRYKECLALLNPMNFDETPTATSSTTGTVSSRLSVPNSATPSHGGSSHASTSGSSTGTHLTWTGSIASVDVDARDSKMWRLVEVVRGRCLQGMAMEKLKQEEEALIAYEAALPLLRNLRIADTAPAQTSTQPHPSFTKYRELWRWAERLLWRAACLVSKYGSIQRAMAIFRVYASQAQFFPSHFRPNHRGVVTALHLQGLLLTSPGSINAPRNQTRLAWITESRTLLAEYRLVLATSTVFPRAGERNVKVEEYCDALVAIWERSGARGNDAGWVIEILWWASRMTFHSHRIFRHLFRLLHVSGENMLAKRTLKLYVQLVTKSRQASMSEIESTMRRRRTLDSLDNDPAVMGEGEPVEESSGADNDRQFVGGLIFGARMLCRLPGDADDIKWAKECLDIAKDTIANNARLGRDFSLKARLSCADGIVESTLAYRDANRQTRPLLMRSSVDHLASAVQFDPESADGYYHLAVALLQAGSTRDLDASIRAARHAVELESTEIRHWHLLGLALSASGENSQARKVLEIGEALETDEEIEPQQEDNSMPDTVDGSVMDTPRSDSPTAVDSLLGISATSAPLATSMLLPVPDHPHPSREDLFEHGLQLRMTLLALIERMHGAETASARWVDVFAWFAERGGWAQPVDDRRASFELPPIHTLPPSDSGHGTEESEASLPVPLLTVTRSQSATHLPTSGLPITIIPPTPSENGDVESIHTVRLSNDKEDEHGAPRKKKAHQIIKEQVNKRQSQIQTFSKKLGRSNTLRSQMSRASSTPDISLMLGDNSRLYQASSIHSRQRMSPRNSYIGFASPSMAPTPPPAPLAAIVEQRTDREKRLIADLWLTSAATFRRMGKLDEARAAIQEAETLDEGNPSVWVQLGLYFVGNGEITHAITAFHKALVIDPDHIPAVVHLAQQYLNPVIGQTTAIASEASESRKGAVDLAAGMLSSFTKGPGWDVPEAWYLLAKAVSLQGRPERERECLTYALGLIEGKPIRDIRVALDCAELHSTSYTMTTIHPLDPLTPQEISSIARTIRIELVKDGIHAFKFLTATALLPKKTEVLEALGIVKSTLLPIKSKPIIARAAEVDFINPADGYTYNVVLAEHQGTWTVKAYERLPDGVHPQITPEELNQADEAVRRDKRIIELAAEIGVTAEQLHADGWSIGYDDRFEPHRRLQQCLLFARYGPHENLYAHPLDFFPVLDSNTMEVLHVDFAAHRTKPDGSLSASTTQPQTLQQSGQDSCGRDRIPPPTRAFEYLPDRTGLQMRQDLKPLHIIQPEGPSFTVKGHVVEWQKWSMHVAFSAREGIAISTVTYNDNGTVRPLFYRLSLAEMVVPYAEVAAPHARKFAFDVGEYGMGTQGNDLTLGCDCLGTIHYLPGNYIGHSGEPITIKQAICIHEEDDGILWKHTDFRPGGRAHSVRSRRLVISMVATVANYEYAWYYYFGQDGSISFEVRLTGMLNVYVLAPGESSAPFGTTVAPQINAHYHQHIFSFRIDPCIDGIKNTVVESDVVPLSAPTGSAQNFAGNGFVLEERVVKSAKDGGRSYDFAKDRRWTIVNRAKTHYASGRPVGYGLQVRGACTELLAKPDSWIARRALFATKSLWVVRDDEDNQRMWPAGKYVPQTRADPNDSVATWCTGDDSLEDQDLVLFLTMGITHIPHPEQWPVMPVEKLEISLKPISFFEQNPALDVPSSTDPKSTLAFNGVHEHETQGAPGGTGSILPLTKNNVIPMNNRLLRETFLLDAVLMVESRAHQLAICATVA